MHAVRNITIHQKANQKGEHWAYSATSRRRAVTESFLKDTWKQIGHVHMRKLGTISPFTPAPAISIYGASFEVLILESQKFRFYCFTLRFWQVPVDKQEKKSHCFCVEKGTRTACVNLLFHSRFDFPLERLPGDSKEKEAFFGNYFSFIHESRCHDVRVSIHLQVNTFYLWSFMTEIIT